jgi:adenylate kinase
MKLLLMGPQACGKGTIGKMLAAKLGTPLISIGKLLRELPEEHPRYKEVNVLMQEGELVTQDLVAAILEERISQKDCENGYILDGWYRSHENMRLLDVNPDLVFLLNISEETTLKRISGRRTCDSDGQIYNIYTLPKSELAKCKGKLVQRADDTSDAVKERLRIYHQETVPVIDHLRERGTKVVDVSAEVAPKEIFEIVIQELEAVI